MRRLHGNARGGLARVANMTPEELSAANKKAAVARWSRLTAEERTAWRVAANLKLQAKREGKTTGRKRRS